MGEGRLLSSTLFRSHRETFRGDLPEKTIGDISTMAFVGVHISAERAVEEVWQALAGSVRDLTPVLPALSVSVDSPPASAEVVRRLTWRDGVRTVDEVHVLSPGPSVIVSRQRCELRDQAHFSYALYALGETAAIHLSGFAPQTSGAWAVAALEIACELAAQGLIARLGTDRLKRLSHMSGKLHRARLGAYGEPLGAFLRQVEQPAACADPSLLHFVVRCLIEEGRPTALRSGLSQRKLRKAQELMTSDLSCSPSIEDLARSLHLSPGHFSRAFRVSCGEPPLRWLMRKRIEHAATLLSDKGRTLANIALECGFANQAHFTRVFTAHFQTSPAALRKSLHGDGSRDRSWRDLMHGSRA